MLQNAMPLLAIRFGASAWFLATISWTAHGLRLPFCFGAGALSERIGRIKIILPAALVFTLMTGLLGFAKSKEQVLLIYLVIMPCVGAFYPALQAMIGDVSERGELRKNLSAFNAGWCVGGSLFAVGAGALLEVGRALPFLTASLAGLIVAVLSLSWSRSKPRKHAADIAAALPPAGILYASQLLLISRIGHFLSFFGLTMARVLYPKLGAEMELSESAISVIVSMMLIGQAVGVFITGASGWWRGKLWPQMISLTLMMAAAGVVWLTSSTLIVSAAFFTMGFALAIAYTGALYYGMQSRKNIGRNTGIHESLVAGGNILGSLVGGAVAELINLRVPYLLFAVLCASGLIVSTIVWVRRPADMEIAEV